MTPISFARTPSVTTEEISGTPASDGDSGDESLPPHTSEIGTLKKLPNHGTAWLGSSSGVYFVNTVRRAFSAALIDANTSSIPPSEEILTGEDAEGHNYNGPATTAPSAIDGDFRRVILASLGRPPVDQALAMELITSFFRCWHPLFPFLHGPRFLQDVEAIYAMDNVTDTESFTSAEARKVITFQLVINIASLDRNDVHLPVESRIKSTSDVVRVAGCFSVNHDIAAIQLLIAAELYLVATISLRRASTVAGMILKLIYHAGLHRCPLRYASLSLEDCEIRKRIFWSAYALDRHLSLSLGDPNTVQDNDIDVCLSGRELHKAVAHELIMNPGDEIRMHLPKPQTGPHGLGSPADDPRIADINDGPQAREKTLREAAMTAYVRYGKLTGRIIEIFHKSIHARFQKPDAITFLNSDIETWWNDLPASLTNEDGDGDMRPQRQPPADAKHPNDAASSDTSNASPSHKQLTPFFLILYHQLQLLLNRPKLSLDQSTAEFQHGLQMCIKASRSTLTSLKKHRDNKQSMLLPGLLSAAWMAGLIIAFACQLGKYPKMRACSDISTSLKMLESMGSKHWFTVKNCHKVLSLLLENIKSRKASVSGFLSAAQPQQRAPESLTVTPSNLGNTSGPPQKRNHESNNLSQTISSPKRTKSISEASPTSTSELKMRPPARSKPAASGVKRVSTPEGRRQSALRKSTDSAHSDGKPEETSNPSSIAADQASSTHAQMDWTDSNASDNSPYMANNLSYQPKSSTFRPFTSSSNATSNAATTTDTVNNLSGSALYSHPVDIANAQSSHQLNLNLPNTFPGETLNIDDPVFWGNFDYNFDIFGAASWENMIGGTGNDGMGFADLFGSGSNG